MTQSVYGTPQYTIVKGDGALIESFCSQIDQLIKEGYRPIGGVVTITPSATGGTDLLQALELADIRNCRIDHEATITSLKLYPDARE